jgi:hypothetical protein
MELLFGIPVILWVIFAIIWLILPFIVMGTNKRLDSVIELMRSANTQLFTISQLLKQTNDKLPTPPPNDEEIVASLNSGLSVEAMRISGFLNQKGDYSATYIANELKIPQVRVEEELIKLYQARRIHEDQCEKILGRLLTKDELR